MKSSRSLDQSLRTSRHQTEYSFRSKNEWFEDNQMFTISWDRFVVAWLHTFVPNRNGNYLARRNTRVVQWSILAVVKETENYRGKIMWGVRRVARGKTNPARRETNDIPINFRPADAALNRGQGGTGKGKNCHLYSISRKKRSVRSCSGTPSENVCLHTGATVSL